jgi:hypothetical protein
MKVGDMVHYVEQRMVEIEFIGIIVDGPDYRGDEATYKVWWTNQHNSDGSAKMGWWQYWRLRVINESR